ncbi:MAG: metallophosphoesterase [Bacteroidales bacterium]|nr:metallophosphoesterase [Bacteroidales bacterium]MBN2764584.1 metallophosphoesterase [Bacteroidales bacterium]
MFYGLTAQDCFRVFPYVQNPAVDAISIIWFSEENSGGLLSYWKQGTDTKNKISSDPVLAQALAYPLWEDTTFFAGQAPPAPFRHRIRIENLEPAARYEYLVIQGHDTFKSTFLTAPDKNIPIRFIAYADSETEPESTGKYSSWDDPLKDSVRTYLIDQTTGYRNNLEVIRSRQPDLIFISGDLVESGGEQRDWDEFWHHNTKQNGEISLAGKMPIMAVLGNHEYYEGPYLDRYNQPGSERAVKRFLTYFEAPANNSPNTEQEGRYYCMKYGPATFIVLDLCNNDTNKAGDDTNFYLLGESDSLGGNAPDFGPGSRQYIWLEKRLAEAQEKSLFTFVFFHHIPYSSGPHGFPPGETDSTDNQSGQPVRLLTPLFMQYGVDAIISGHDEIWERSVVSGVEIKPDQREESHTLHFYDVGIGGDGLRGPSEGWNNPFQKFMVHKDVSEVWEDDVIKDGGKHYGHLEVDILPGDTNTWQAILRPVYVFPLFDRNDSAYTHYERRVYNDTIVLTSYYGDFVLPVEYTSFSAVAHDSGILINWITPSEKGNYGFEILRRVNSGWQKIAFIEGRDTSSQTSLYAYLDTSFVAMQPNMTLYYRLKQVDIDGNGHYSDSVRVETFTLNGDIHSLFSFAGNYPNPFKAETIIECHLQEPCLIRIRIYNMQGEMIRLLADGHKADGCFRTLWDGRDEQGNQLNPGIFLYKIETTTGHMVWNRMVLLR